jgi:hypothetical protein
MVEGRREAGMGEVRWYDISACGVRRRNTRVQIYRRVETRKEKGESIRQRGDNDDESCRLAEG